jgi:helix-turn-helix protein
MGNLLSIHPTWKGMIFLDKEKIYQYIYSMIESSTKKPKYMSISTVKVANLLGYSVSEIDQLFNDFVSEGRLRIAKLEGPPFHDVYLLP